MCLLALTKVSFLFLPIFASDPCMYEVLLWTLADTYVVACNGEYEFRHKNFCCSHPFLRQPIAFRKALVYTSLPVIHCICHSKRKLVKWKTALFSPLSSDCRSFVVLPSWFSVHCNENIQVLCTVNTLKKELEESSQKKNTLVKELEEKKAQGRRTMLQIFFSAWHHWAILVTNIYCRHVIDRYEVARW